MLLPAKPFIEGLDGKSVMGEANGVRVSFVVCLGALPQELSGKREVPMTSFDCTVGLPRGPGRLELPVSLLGVSEWGSDEGM